MGERHLRAPERRAIMAWVRERPVLPRAEWERLDEQARRRAFSVVLSTHLNVLREVFEQADRALAEDLSYDAFSLRTMEALSKRWGDADAPAWLAVMDTNMQAAYNAGRFVELLLPERLSDRPYFLFDPVLDERTSPVCWHRRGIVRRYDDPFWQGNWPPLHIRCRSALRALTPAQARAHGPGPDTPPEAPQKGWGHPPRLEEYFPEQRAESTLATESLRFPPSLYAAFWAAISTWREKIPALRDDLRQQPAGAWRSVEEAEAWAQANYPRVTWALRGLDLAVVREGLSWWHQLAQQHPDTAVTVWTAGEASAAARHVTFFDRWGEDEQHASQGRGAAVLYQFGLLLVRWLRTRREALLPVVAPDGFGRVDRTLALWQRRIRADGALSAHATTGRDEAFAEGMIALHLWPPSLWPPYVVAQQQLLLALAGGVDAWVPADKVQDLRAVPPAARAQVKQEQAALALRIGLQETDL